MRCVLAAGWLVVAGSAVARGGGVPSIELELIADGLSKPVFVTHAPGDHDRVFIVEQQGGALNRTGWVRIYRPATGQIDPTPFLTINALSPGAEQGLFGLAFHPDHAANGHVYINYVVPGGFWGRGITVIERFTLSQNPDVVDALSGREVIRIDQPQINHNGGWIEFGPDGYLYIAMGDGGGQFDQEEGHAEGGNAQDLETTLHGKILRLDVDAETHPGGNYAIPPNNPFAGAIPGLDEIWHLGLRHPWRCGFDRATGDLYIADVGQHDFEEINRQPGMPGGLPRSDPGYTGGMNFGWRCLEAFDCTGLTGCLCTDTELAAPIYAYPHGQECSVIGGTVYRGAAIPALQGLYVFADYCSGRIFAIDPLDPPAPGMAPVIADLSIGITSFGEDAAGELYVCYRSAVYRIVPAPLAPCAGDVNGDGMTNASDLSVLIGSFGASVDPGTMGDLNGDGLVNAADLSVLIGDFGADCTGG